MTPEWKPVEADGDEDEPVVFATESGAIVKPGCFSLCVAGLFLSTWNWAARTAARTPRSLLLPRMSGYPGHGDMLFNPTLG